MCEKRQIAFARSRPGTSNDGAHVEQKNWPVVRTVVGYLRYDTAAELMLRGKIWVLQSQLTNYFYPQQKLISKQHVGAKVTKRYDCASTPQMRAHNHEKLNADDKATLASTYASINPAAVQRQIQALTSELIALVPVKNTPTAKSAVSRAFSDESTHQASRAS